MLAEVGFALRGKGFDTFQKIWMVAKHALCIAFIVKLLAQRVSLGDAERLLDFAKSIARATSQFFAMLMVSDVS